MVVRGGVALTAQVPSYELLDGQRGSLPPWLTDAECDGTVCITNGHDATAKVRQQCHRVSWLP